MVVLGGGASALACGYTWVLWCESKQQQVGGNVYFWVVGVWKMMLSLKLLFKDPDNDLVSSDSGLSERCTDCMQKTKSKWFSWRCWVSLYLGMCDSEIILEHSVCALWKFYSFIYSSLVENYILIYCLKISKKWPGWQINKLWGCWEWTCWNSFVYLFISFPHV